MGCTNNKHQFINEIANSWIFSSENDRVLSINILYNIRKKFDIRFSFGKKLKFPFYYEIPDFTAKSESEKLDY